MYDLPRPPLSRVEFERRMKNAKKISRKKRAAIELERERERKRWVVWTVIMCVAIPFAAAAVGLLIALLAGCL